MENSKKTLESLQSMLDPANQLRNLRMFICMGVKDIVEKYID